MSELHRRSLIATAAALFALSVPPTATASPTSDPVLALVERHRLLQAARNARLDVVLSTDLPETDGRACAIVGP
jgi:hypothetical protein